MNKKKNFWNHWHGCHKCSPGCLHCYVYYLDQIRNIDAGIILKSKTNFNLPLKKNRQGEYKIPSNTILATCFTSDFFLEEADLWRPEIFRIMKERVDVTFLIPTKRIERFLECIPEDWGMGYDNVIIAVTCENQKKADERLPIFLALPIKHRQVFVAPILEYVELAPYLKTGLIELVSVGGESYENARVCDFSWVKKMKETCDFYHVLFDFHQTGSNFVFEGKRYFISHHKEYIKAKKAMIYLQSQKKV